MEPSRPSLRLLAALLVVALPPLVAFAALSVFAGEWLLARGIGTGTQLLIGAIITIIWAALVAAVAGRLAATETSSMLEIVERGTAGSATDVEQMTAIQRRLTTMLDERNRQLADLAEFARQAPIAADAVTVTRSMTAAARSLTGDPTWTVVVLGATTASLPTGAYGPDPAEPASPITEVHRWASTLEPAADPAEASWGARHAIGPWGAFVVVDVAAGEELRAVLMAPWEGRQAPSRAELSLYSLVGRHAATAIEHALLYTKVREQADELNRLAGIQSDFLRGITHDLQTPLTSIGALASELRGGAGLQKSALADLETIAHQADRLRRMVGQLLAVSRLEVGQLTPRSDVFRVEPILRRTWDALRADRRVAITVEGEPHLAVGDSDRFEQVIWAVLDNAVKYSPGGSLVDVSLALATDDGGARAVVTVRDEGAGMDAEAIEHAFDQFYRSSTARRLAPDGSGIGLYAARGLMRAMGGDVTIESRLGAGTTVTLWLPAERADAEREDAGRGDMERGGEPGAGVDAAPQR